MEKRKESIKWVLMIFLIAFGILNSLIFNVDTLILIPFLAICMDMRKERFLVALLMVFISYAIYNFLYVPLIILEFSLYYILKRLIGMIIKNENFQNVLATTIMTILVSFVKYEDFRYVLIYTVLNALAITYLLYLKFYVLNLLEDKVVSDKKYFLEIVSIQLGKNKKVNGDYIDILEHNGQQYVFLSDGMGYGYQARKISKDVINNLKENIKNKNNLNEALKETNNQLLLKYKYDKYATLDMLCCKNNYISMYKRGAENSFLFRDGQMISLNCDNLPLGIEDRTNNKLETEIKDKDIIVMFSDGVTIQYPGFEEEIKKFKDSEKLYKWIETKSIKAKENVKDDYSIVLIKFDENPLLV